jgi:antitoxin component YwqK of YwqJK toxin-antitoxin module
MNVLLILNTNILKFILNGYLDYNDDIIKLKKLISENVHIYFDIKSHIICENIRINDNNKPKFYDLYNSKFNKEFLVYLDKKIIIRKTYYQGKNMRSINNYKNGDRTFHGEQIEYYANGRVKMIETYENGLLNGSRKIYSPRAILMHFNYKNQYQDGTQRIYDRNGVLIYEARFDEGKLIQDQYWDV